ncbi:MAG: CYTH domain-containing protein [Crocinitomicaceae bacterium]|nr:CYTH domain-containing protein [Crocinitomicaceae bacterium]
MQEIEYKFLVDKSRWATVQKPVPTLIVQGFISKSKEAVVRVRIKGDKGFLTIKGKSEGISRQEFEYEIPVIEAEELLSNFTHKQIRKHRYEIEVHGKTWEVDEFHGALEGLVIAELEVESESESFEKPEWVTEDVSTDPAYYNAVLIDRC